MNFKLGLVGHIDSLTEIENVALSKFSNMEIYKVEFNSDRDLEKAFVKMKKIIRICDGILYTRLDPYKLISSRIDHNTPFRCIEIEASDFIHGLLRTLYHKSNTNIGDISIDTLDYVTIMSAYKSLNLDADALKIQLVDVDTNLKNYVSRCAEEHIKNYEHGISSLCVTTITYVYHLLTSKNIPCTLLTPTSDTYVSEIRHLILNHRIKKAEKDETVAIYITLNQKNDFYTINGNQFQEIMELNKISEYIAIFSQTLDGAMITVGDNRYIIFCKSKNLEIVTEDFTNISILSKTIKNTSYTLNVGIGYGTTLKEVKSNSIVAVNRAAQEGGNKAYIAYSMQNIIGPIEPDEVSKANTHLFDKRLVKIAENTGLSINTIYKIDCLIMQNQTRSFTSHDLAELLGVSTRTVNRIIAKLENKDYITEVGKHVIGEMGRPSRVFKILF